MLDVALQLEGLYRNASTRGRHRHRRPAADGAGAALPCCSELPATQYNMKWVESAGLVKFDFLGLEALTVVDRAMRHLEKRGAGFPARAARAGERPRLRPDGNLRPERSGVPAGRAGDARHLRQLKPSLEEVTALISLYRPGPMDSIPEYVDCKSGRKPVNVHHPMLEPVLAETYGVIVYGNR